MGGSGWVSVTARQAQRAGPGGHLTALQPYNLTTFPPYTTHPSAGVLQSRDLSIPGCTTTTATAFISEGDDYQLLPDVVCAALVCMR